MPPRHVKIGILVPSSNTNLEPLINDMLSTVNSQMPSVRVTVHYSRFRVTQISLGPTSASQFNLETIIQAASLLADAKVNAIAWGGTSAGWLGLDTDHQLCEAIESQFGIPAHTSTLALVALIDRFQPDHRTLGVMTPYVPEMNELIRQNLAKANIDVVLQHQPLSITDNHIIASVDAEQLTSMVDNMLSYNQTLGMVTVFCTNLSAAHLARRWELAYQDRGLFVVDSMSTVVWGALQKAGVSTKGTGVAQEWGRIFDL